MNHVYLLVGLSSTEICYIIDERHKYLLTAEQIFSSKEDKKETKGNTKIECTKLWLPFLNCYMETSLCTSVVRMHWHRWGRPQTGSFQSSGLFSVSGPWALHTSLVYQAQENVQNTPNGGMIESGLKHHNLIKKSAHQTHLSNNRNDNYYCEILYRERVNLKCPYSLNIHVTMYLCFRVILK